jgi:hypothetical protein
VIFRGYQKTADFLAIFPDSADSNQIPEISNRILESAESAQDPLFSAIFSCSKKPGFAKNLPDLVEYILLTPLGV